MAISENQRLLCDYAQKGSESAFRELVGRYIDFVYSTALRLGQGDSHRAEDITQIVFTDLARMAHKLSTDSMIGGWLHRHTCFVAATVRRGERRRKIREMEALNRMKLTNDEADRCWDDLAPFLDDAINQLGEQDRTAVLLRFFEHRSMRSIAETLGTSENAAQKRIGRALEQLHSILGKRGIVLPVAALGTVLAADVTTAAPAGLAAAVAGTALGTATAGGGPSLTLLKIMTMTKLKATIVGSLIVAGLSTSLFVERNALVEARADLNGAEARSSQFEDEVSQLQADNQRLSQLKSNAADPELSQRESELLRLRGEVGSLRQQNQDLTNALKLANASVAEPANEQGQSTPLGLSFKTAAAQNRGFGSVPAALQTVVWTALNGEPQSICALEGDAATNADGSPTPWRDKMVEFYQNLFNGVDSVQLVDTTPRADGTLEVKMKLQHSNNGNQVTSAGSTVASAILKQNEGAWQISGWLTAVPSPASGQQPAGAR